jgi:uncharacterized protein (TIGR01777 family)
MRVLLSGGTGMIGQTLVSSLLADKHQAIVLTRSPQRARLPQGAQAIGWDGQTSKGWGEWASQAEAVVNLVGERLSKWPWTENQRKRFWNSRVDGGLALVEAIRAASPRPKVLIQASGVNYYGPRGLSPVTEEDASGMDYLAELCRAWEDSTKPVEEMGVRRVIIRSAVVLDAKDGILPLMMLPAKLFTGGRLGNGRQGLPWIHLQDEVGAIRFLMEKEEASGPFNLSGPTPISSAEFLRTLARVLKRPYWLPVPGFALRMVLGGMATLILDGMYILPKRLQELGYPFRFETAEAALRDLLAG